MLCRAIQLRWVMVERSDRMWSTGEGTDKPLQYSCLENPMNSMKRQKDRTVKDEIPRSVGAQFATGDQWRNNTRKNEEMEPKQKQHPVVDGTGDRNKVQCCKEQYCISSIQSFSHVWLFATPWIAACQASLSITNSWSSLRLMSIESVMPSSHLILCRLLLLQPPIPPRWPKYWSFSFSIIPSKEIPGLISFRMDWLDLLAVQGTLKRAELDALKVWAYDQEHKSLWNFN